MLEIGVSNGMLYFKAREEKQRGRESTFNNVKLVL
jgi:hypothetical protein